jgi:hypothetical protein
VLLHCRRCMPGGMISSCTPRSRAWCTRLLRCCGSSRRGVGGRRRRALSSARETSSSQR